MTFEDTKLMPRMGNKETAERGYGVSKNLWYVA